MLPAPVWMTAGVVSAAAAAEWIGGAGAALPAAGVVAGGAVAAALAAELGRRPRAATAAAAAALGAALVVARLAVGVAAGGTAVDATGPGGTGPGGATALPAGDGPWRAEVVSAREVKGQQYATIRLVSPPLLCAATFPARPRLIAADTVEWPGRVRPLGSTDYDAYLAAQGVQARCDATGLTVVGHDDSPMGRLEEVRQASGDALQLVLPEPAGGLEAAILIGLRDRVDRDLAAAFTTAGVSHVVAISGWNIAIVAGTVAAMLRGRMTRRRRAIAMLAAIVAYTLFAGASPSVVRAALMAGVALATVESGRGSRAMVGLGWAATAMIVVEPATVADPGFQLSAAATAGLVMWASPLTALLEVRVPRLPASLRESLGVSLAAQAATLPLALLDFGRLAVIAPAANLVVVPLVPPVMATGLIAFVAGWLAALGAPSWLTGPMAMPAALLLGVMIAVVGFFAAIPGANQTLAPPANVAAAAVAAALLVPMHRLLRPGAGKPGPSAVARSAAQPRPPARATSKHTWLRLRTVMAGALLLAAMAGAALAARPDGAIHVVVLDVGQGDAILLEGDRGGRILVDGGPDPARLIAALDGFIPAWDRHLDAIVLTHPHDDHVAGLVAVVERYRVGRAFESGRPANTPAYRAWIDAMAARGLRPEPLRTGATVQLDGATLHVLWPDDGTTRPPELDPAASANRQTNDSSVVFLGEFQNRRFLLTGDAEDDVDPILLSRGLPPVDMLKVAHHGSATASSDALLAALRPAVSVISVGAGNDYGHPNGGTVARLRAHSGTVARTDLDGTVEVSLDRAAVTVTRSGARPGPSPAAAAIGDIAAAPLPLYDSADVRPDPTTERGLAALTETSVMAPAPLACGGRDGRLARIACGSRGYAARSPPGRIGRAAA